MNKILLSLILGIFLISCVSASITVTLNSPADGSTQYTNNVTQFNASSTTTNSMINNMSLFTNQTGTWSLINTSQIGSGIFNGTASNGTNDTSFGTVAWANPQNIFNIDGAYATTTISGSNSNYLKASGFNFNIPSGSTINSIQIWWYGSRTGATGVEVHGARLYKNNVAVGTVNTTVNGFNPSDSWYYEGGDLWGTTWTASDINNAGFGGGIYVSNGGGSAPVQVDKIMIIVNYSSTNSTLINNTYQTGSNIKWNVQACDNTGACSFSTSNKTFSIDSLAPTITLNYPTAIVNYAALNSSLQLNYSAIDTNLQYCWYNYNFTNSSLVACSSGVNNLANITLTNQKNITIYANDTAGNLNATTYSWDYNVFENSRTFNSSTYETAHEGYTINVTANSSLTGVNLIYNGSSFIMNNLGSGIWSYSMDVPSSVIGTQTFNYNFLYGGNTYSSSNSTQTVSAISFGLCNGSLTNTYINFSFEDEYTLLAMNATMQTVSWIYYLGLGTVNKSYVYTTSNTSANYTFCFSNTLPLKAIPIITYLNTSYPARTYQPGTLSLNNTLSNVLLYLLSSSNGIYTTFITSSLVNTPISSVNMLITRLISGNLVTVAQGISDNAGSFTAWLNPNYPVTVTASKSGYGSTTQTVTPTQSTYTLVLSNSLSNYTFIDNKAGLIWKIFPLIGLLDNSTNNFGFNITSINNNIVGCQIQLTDPSFTTIYATGTTISTNSSTCSVYTTYSAINGTSMHGRLLVDLGSGYQILEEDAYWILEPVNGTGSTLLDWMKSIQNLPLSFFNNDVNHQEFSNIIIFFLIVTIIIATLNQFGFELSNRGGMIWLMCLFVWFASIPGFLNMSNLFGSVQAGPFPIVYQYFLAVVYTLFCVGYTARSFS
jgi:hypothetical protein